MMPRSREKGYGEINDIFWAYPLLCVLNHVRHFIYVFYNHEQFWKGDKMFLILLLS